jgi:TolB protein
MSLRAKAVGSLVLGALLLLVVTQVAYATFPGANGKIAFSGNGDGDYELYSMNPDGTGRTQLTHNDIDENLSDLNDVSPTWSPRGDRLLFQRGRSIPALTAIDGLYTANPDGTNEQLLFETILTDNGWSPEGNRIVFAACTSAGHGSCFGYTVFTSNPNGGDSRPLDSPSSFVVSVDWSPDGSKIAIGDGQDIWTIPADETGGSTPLVTGPGDNGVPSWSPDGRRLAFMSDRDGNFEIYVMNADGTGQTRLTDNPLTDGNPVWSPDGTRIAFDRRECNTSRCVANILTMDADGTNEVQLTTNGLDTGAFEGGPDWQPIPGPQRGDFKNRAQFCKAERAFFGDDGFRARYGGGANAHGKCISSS